MKRILIVGSGIAGESLYLDLINKKQTVIGFLDDNKIGDKILGKLIDINLIIERENISDIYIAIPTVDSKTIRKFINSIEDESINIAIIPRSFNVISDETVTVEDLKDADILHLLGREPIKHDFIEAQNNLKGKIILVTGAAGSIGSELVHQLLLLKPKQVICFDFWENGIFLLQERIGKRDDIKYIIGNIRDKNKLTKVMKNCTPDYVYHAAAYKHVPLMQDNALEAFNNNVMGSWNVISACHENNISNMVLVSTDKAVNPVNVMGASKRMVEMLIEVYAGKETKTKYSAVRFGNVLQSNGSVVNIFKRQIAKNKPITVTHEDVTRYFMSKEEAAQLIIQSSILGNQGEIFTLNMGEPIKITELAKLMIKISKKDLPIKITGLRPGEKMHEDLFYCPTLAKTKHSKIFVTEREKNFDHAKYETDLKDMFKKSVPYLVCNKDIIKLMKSFGFQLQS